MTFLRDIRSAARYFWQPSAAAQIAYETVDRDLNGNRRELPANEILVMALNEIAAAKGEGFFYYLPFREAWKKHDNIELLPASRVPPAPGCRYPDMLYMHRKWLDSERQEFARDPQRARYLKCNAAMARPPDSVPLYAIQYIGYATCPTYTTERESLIIYATDDTYFLATTAQMEAILGRWDKSWPDNGPDPASRLNQPPQLWKKQRSASAETVVQRMNQYALRDPESLFNAVVAACKLWGGIVSATFPAKDLSTVLPHASNPDAGHALGSI